MNRRSLLVPGLVAIGCGLFAVGCSKGTGEAIAAQSPPSARVSHEPSPASSPPGTTAVAPDVPLLPIAQETNYTISLRDQPLPIGTPSSVMLVIRPGAGLKMNGLYETRMELLRFDETALSVPQPRLSREDPGLQMSDAEAILALPVTGLRDGETAIEGRLRFSVCRGKSMCFPYDKIPFRATLRVGR